MFSIPFVAKLAHISPSWQTPRPSPGGRRSFLQLRDSSGLAAQQPPYSFAVRYDLRPLSKQPLGIS